MNGTERRLPPRSYWPWVVGVSVLLLIVTTYATRSLRWQDSPPNPAHPPGATPTGSDRPQATTSDTATSPTLADELALPIRQLGPTSGKAPLADDPAGILLAAPDKPIPSGSQFALTVTFDVAAGQSLREQQQATQGQAPDWRVDLPGSWQADDAWVLVADPNAKRPALNQASADNVAADKVAADNVAADNVATDIVFTRLITVPAATPPGPHSLTCVVHYNLSSDGQTWEAHQVTLQAEVVVTP